MNKPLTLTQADFDALPIHQYPPGRQVCQRWKRQAGSKWFLVEYVDGEGFIELVIREIVIAEAEQ